MEPQRRSPEELLRQVQAEEEAANRGGRLKVFLGYASGVGKSFRMFDEGRRRRERGEDVIIGAVQPSTSPEVQAILKKLEVSPLRVVDGVPVMDVPAILKRHPSVCLVDGLAYNNPPGSRNPARWKDVQELIRSGIDVITSINIQYIDELRERVAALTGKKVRDTVPQSFLYSADEVVVVDVPPERSQTEGSGGEMGGETARGSQRLSELREIALLLAADVVDHQLEQYLVQHGVTQSLGAQERILVCITPRANAHAMIQSGRRNADRFHGELFVAYVEQPNLAPEDKTRLDSNLALARNAGAQIEILSGEDAVEAILQFARERGITQIFVGHSQQQKWWQTFLGNPVDRLIDRSYGMDVRVFPH